MLAGANQPSRTALPGKILVVDDEQRILRFLVRGLQAEGFAVDAADNGADGLHKALEGGYDLVILDLLMPGMDGASVLRQLVARRPAQAVLVLSCLNATATKVRLLEAGAEDYLAKPFSLDELLARVRARLRVATGRATSLVAGRLRLDLIRREADSGSGPVAAGRPRVPTAARAHAAHRYDRLQAAAAVGGLEVPLRSRLQRGRRLRAPAPGQAGRRHDHDHAR